ncbi:hypothetical protein ScPMuIL_015425 [Solemya velum]
MATCVARSASRALGLVIAKSRTFGDLPYQTFTKLYDSLVWPVIGYGAAIWGTTSHPCIEAVQNRALRFFMGVGRYTPSAGSNSLEMPTIPQTGSDWQADKTLLECAQYMLEQEVACDVKVLVGKTKMEKIGAHKFILISRSPVFAAMFCGPLTETQEAITIPDIETGVFKTLLRYMYCDEVSLDIGNVADVLYAAKKYCVVGLTKACRKYISDNIDNENACFFLSHADKLDEQDLFQTCLDYILLNGENCLKSSSFFKMNRCCVEKVVGADSLSSPELCVWEALVRWAEAECERQGLTVTDGNIRLAMDELAYSVRFRAIGPEMFAKHVAIRSVLTDSEMVGIFRFCHQTVDAFDNFSTKVHRSGRHMRCFRLNDNRFRHVNQGFGVSMNAISLTVSPGVFLSGLVLYGCNNSRRL